MVKEIKSIFKNRIWIVLMGLVSLFGILVFRLYNLQIIQGKEHLAAIRATILRTVPIDAQRGNIYDRWGRPLAENVASYAVKIDMSVQVNDLNKVLMDFLQILDQREGKYVDQLPITQKEPFTFTFSSASAERRWKTDMGLKGDQMNFTGEETLEYLKKYFKLPSNLSKQDVRRLISIRSKIYMQRFKQYNSVTLARNVGPQIIASIEEHYDQFPGIYIETDSLRHYPEGENVSHILGYIGSINEDELSKYEQYGYENTDLVGKLGIEKAYELTLNGKDGERVIEVDPMGKRVSEKQVVPPIKGGDVYLTIDAKLQEKTLKIVKENLKKILLENLDSGKINLNQVFQSMVDSNYISIKEIMERKSGEVQNKMKEIILKNNSQFDLNKDEDIKKAKEMIVKSIENRELTLSEMTLSLIEQNKISLTQETIQDLKNGSASPYNIIKEKIISDEIPLNKINMDPSTGSVAVVDVNSGETLALVTYPSYDNNELVNDFNNEYYQTLLHDPTTPLINRPLMERKAPGSILKMMSAVAGLESGTITDKTIIYDQGVFKDAGKPYAKCLIYSRYGVTHGAVDVRKAIEVSCNYFFYELAYRFGNAKDGSTLDSIGMLDKYMKKFGLNEYSGLEIEELKPKIAAPESGSERKWMDGDSIRAAIGQSYNSFAAIHIAKYIATLANGGTRYKMSLVKGTRDKDSKEIHTTNPVMEENLHLKEDTLKAVQEGMFLVTHGNQGTLRNYLRDFPIEVAAKTGTAEEANNRPSHSWFAGFAPYDDPQIAVVVMIPFGETTLNPATQIAREVIAEYFNLYKDPDGPSTSNVISSR